MARLGVILSATLLVLLAATRAVAVEPLCDILGSAIGFTAIAKEELRAKAGRTKRYYFPSPFFREPACAPTIDAGRAARWYGYAAAMVATRNTGTAIAFKILTRAPRCHSWYGGFQYCAQYLCGYEYPCNAHRVNGDIVTGGGSVYLPQDLLPTCINDEPAVVDTSGTHPELEACAEAISRIDEVSAALAEGRKPGEPPSAARPIIDLGDLLVERDETRILESTDGQDVTFYRVRNLTLMPGKLYCSYGYCYQNEGAFLEFAAGPEQSVVLNVTGRVRLGAGTRVFDYDGASIVNVVGPGGAIVLRRQAEVQASLLAPDRAVFVLARGGGTEFPYGSLGRVMAREVKIHGSGFLGYYMFSPDWCGSPSGAFLDPLD